MFMSAKEPEAEERGTGRQPQVQTRHPGRAVHRPRQRNAAPCRSTRRRSSRRSSTRRNATATPRRRSTRHRWSSPRRPWRNPGRRSNRMQGRFTEYQRAGTYKPAVAMKWARRLVDRTAGDGRGTVDQPPAPPGRRTAHPGTRRHAGSDAGQEQNGGAGRPSNRTCRKAADTPDAIGDEPTRAATENRDGTRRRSRRARPWPPFPETKARNHRRRRGTANRNDGTRTLKSTLDRFRTRLRENLGGLNADHARTPALDQ